MRRTFSRVWIFLLATASLLGAQAVIPGKFYEYYTVASTQAGTFTALGPPAINDNGLCAFTGTTAAGQTIWVSDGHFTPVRDINPGQANLGTNFFDPQLQINTASQVVAKDFIPGTSQNIRIWDALATDSFVYQARAGIGQAYTALNGAPSVNATGDAVFGAINGTTHELVEVSNGVSNTFGVNSSAPEPVIAANGSMVVTTLNRGTGLNQIVLFTNNFASQTTIASGTNFSYLDTAPGISDDGNVVVFQGNLTPAGATNLGIPGGAGPGIFAAANTGSAWQIIRVTGLQVEVLGSGGNNDGVCDPGETCKNAAELGFDDNNSPINFSSYPTNARVAVVNNDFGLPGIDDDSFVISFMGTPSHASRTNPVTKIAPLLFSSNLGLWTIRVDVKQQLVGTNARVFHPYTAIPVIQVGDQLGTNNFISSISINMQIANAAEDETGVDRTMRRGDHRVAFQATMSNGVQAIFRANHLDSSQDGILDSWKTSGIDIDGDGFSDISLSGMGAVVGQRDLFLEMDWLSDQPGFNFHPSPGVVTAFGGGAGYLPAMLANAPQLVGNMYGVRRDGTAPATIPQGITIHIDGGTGMDFDGEPFSYNMGIGPLNGGDQIGMAGNNSALVEVLYLGVPGSINIPGINTRALQDAKDNFFGSQDKDARELAFKYAVLANHHSFLDSPPAAHPIAGGGSNFILVGDPFPAGGVRSGNYIKITGGTGAGQVQRITGFDTVVLNKMYVTPFNTDPDASSTFVYISGSSGNSEVYFYPSPDNNSLPGNDFMLDLGDWGVSSDGTLMDPCSQWETLAHEMGHTLGLRHGGVDHQTQNANYHSLMSYVYQMECNPPTPVQSFSTAGDLVYDDFANLNHQFAQVFFHTGNSLGVAYGASAEAVQQAPEQNVQDYINKNGPIDLIKPVIAISAPAAGSQVGSSLTVTIQATDNVSVAKVKASFDANGDGVLSPSEIVTAVPAGGNLYTATFPSVSGTLSPRTLTAIAYDNSGNDGKTSISLNVGTVTQFALTVTEAGTGSGSVTSSPSGINCPATCSANYNSGTPVTLTAAAGSGSTFAGWSGACSGTGTCSVTMSAAKAVTATFNTVQFALTVTEAGTGSGSVSSIPSGISCPTTCSANYNSGTPVTLTAVAGTGSTFAGWSGACTGTGSCSVTMSAAKSVTATFNTTPVQFALTVTEAGTGSGTVTSSPTGISCPTTCSANYNSGTPVTLTAVAGSGSTFAGWNGACTGTGSCSVTMSAAQSVTATFNTVQFALTVTEAGTGSGTVSSSPSGISCPTTCSANYNSGTPVTLTAAAGTGSTFAGWSGACSGTGTCSVTMSAAQSVTATFNAVQFALTVTEAGTGSGSVTSSPGGINCPTTCSANYNSGTPVTLTAAAGTGSTFAGWSGACTGTGSCSVTMSAAKAVTATFNTVQFALTVTEAGTGTGTVTSSPAGISCPTTCSASYNSGTPVTLTAVAGSGSTFAGWSGACTGTGTCSVTMSSALSVTATFNTTPVQFALTVTEAGTGTGTVTSSPAGISCPTTCSANYNSGTPVTLTAAAGTGSTFAGWSGGCSGTGTCSVTMSAAKSVTATFNTTPVQFALTVTEAGTGTGTVTSSPAGISCPTTCSANYNSGTPVTLTATAGTGSTFAGWSGACSGTGSCSVTMSVTQSVTATFNTTPVQFALTVTEAGTGSGTVTSSPSGISCPSTCSANYNSGTLVTLTATAGTGSTFAGWSGACSGTGTCSVTTSSTQAVTATFNTTPVQFALTVTEAGTGSGTVSSSPTGISCPTTCSANYNSGTPVTLTATAGTGSTFAGWGGACSGTGTCSVTMSSAQAVTATFNTTPVQFALTVTEAGTGSGTVSSSPTGISCPTTCSANYNSGTPVTLTATAGTGSTFAGWGGACSGTGTCSVTMSSAQAVTATFNTTPVQFALTVTEAGTGSGTVTSSPSGISCPTTCSANYNSGTPVTLTAITGTGSTFAGWSGACSGTGTCSVTMSAAKAVTATFNTTPVQFALTVAEAGTGSGTVTSSPVGISCPSTCSANYNSGTPVTLTATATTGSTFAGWSGACTGTGTCSVTMSAAQSVTATFNTTPVQFALTVTEAGTGTGTVTSNPAGISCPATCSANYNSGTPVTLTATSGTGSTFAGWSGACSGTGSCSVTMSSARAVTATFTGIGTESPAISATIVNRGFYSSTVLFVDLQLKNGGSGISNHTALNQIAPSTVAGTGTVTYNGTLSPVLPIAAGNLPPGGTFKVRLYFNVPSTVTRFMLTEKGSMNSATGTVLSYTQSQTLSR